MRKHLWHLPSGRWQRGVGTPYFSTLFCCAHLLELFLKFSPTNRYGGQSCFDELKVESAPPRPPSQLDPILDPPIETQSRPAHSNQNWTHWTPHYIGHLISLDTSFQPAGSNFVLWLWAAATNVSCQFAPYWRTPLLAARDWKSYKLHFVTVCPARNALMVFGFILHHQPLTIHLLVTSPLLLPRLPLEPFGNMPSAKNCLSLLQFPIVKGYEQRTTGWLEVKWLDGNNVWESPVDHVLDTLFSSLPLGLF